MPWGSPVQIEGFVVCDPMASKVGDWNVEGQGYAYAAGLA